MMMTDYREYGPIIYDPRHVEKSLALAECFWWHVENDVEPAPSSWDDVLSVYPDLENKTAMISGEAETEARKMIARGMELKAKAKQIADELDDVKAGLGILAGDVVEGIDDEGLPIVRKTMNRILSDSEGIELARFRDSPGRETLSLSIKLADIEKKVKARAALDKKIMQGKTVSESDIAAVAETDADREVLAIDAKLRELGAYKTSEAYRVVTY
jgi:hypothetical protein